MPIKKAIKFRLLKKGAKITSYAYSGDAGFDIYAVSSKLITKGTNEVISSEIA